jgi:uncharacterized membrane protein YphA (DoxX/SURF4 family)
MPAVSHFAYSHHDDDVLFAIRRQDAVWLRLFPPWSAWFSSSALAITRIGLGLFWLTALPAQFPLEAECGRSSGGASCTKFVDSVILPHFMLFAAIIFMAELVTGISLVSGMFVRLGAFIGLVLSLNLYLGLAHAPGEWYWAYILLILTHLALLTQVKHYFSLSSLLDDTVPSTVQPMNTSVAVQSDGYSPFNRLEQLRQYCNFEQPSGEVKPPRWLQYQKSQLPAQYRP